MFDAACGFGGYRESGYGREGGREGLREYLEPKWFKKLSAVRHQPSGKAVAAAKADHRSTADAIPKRGVTKKRNGSGGNGSAHDIDRTVKLYIGGKQALPRFGLQHGSARRGWAIAGRGPTRKPQRYSQRGGGGAEGFSLGEGDGTQSRAGALLLRGEPFAAARRNCTSPRGRGR